MKIGIFWTKTTAYCQSLENSKIGIKHYLITSATSELTFSVAVVNNQAKTVASGLDIP